MKKHVAILGAGPIGIECALRAIEDGYEVALYDQGEPGANIESWQHVRFFSPWALNRSPRGESLLKDAGVMLGAADAYPTGREYLDEYLRPLTSTGVLAPTIHAHAKVLGVSRRRIMKGEWIGRPQRGASPFIIHLLEQGQERFVEADIVIDATGVLHNPNHLGPGGLPAAGQGLVEAFI